MLVPHLCVGRSEQVYFMDSPCFTQQSTVSWFYHFVVSLAADGYIGILLNVWQPRESVSPKVKDVEAGDDRAIRWVE